jgi:hypothetical protein
VLKAGGSKRSISGRSCLFPPTHFSTGATAASLSMINTLSSKFVPAVKGIRERKTKILFRKALAQKTEVFYAGY